MKIDNPDVRNTATFTRRAMIVGLGQGVLFTGLAARMYHLQILQSTQYAVLAEENRIKIRLLAPLRGHIFDRNNTLLATNQQEFEVILVPEDTPDLAVTMDRLARIVPISAAAREQVFFHAATMPGFTPVTVAENLSWKQFARINVNEPDLPGARPDIRHVRHYPYGPAMAHVIGTMAPVSKEDSDGELLMGLPGFRVGNRGVEEQFDSSLRGQAGRGRVEVDAHGRILREIDQVSEVSGGDITLTLDAGVQKLSADRLEGHIGAVAVMDIHGGDVLALASVPAPNPDDFSRGVSRKEWNRLLNDPRKPLVDRAISGQYPPGSIFKLILAMAALENDAVDPAERAYCNGAYKLGNRIFHCWKKGGHGWMDMERAIMHSCDVYFYQVARKTGIERLAAMARRFGLGEVCGIALPGEKPGRIPTPEWKLARVNDGWRVGDTLNVGIGQGDVLTTPLQLAMMTARIANGGLAVTPRLIRRVGDVEQPHPAAESLEVSRRTLNLIHRGMNAVSNTPGGTAYGSRITGAGMSLAGKTGTSQVRAISIQEHLTTRLKNEALPLKLRDHALFTAFAPVQAPRYAISVIVEHGGSGSRAAAPIARDIMRHVLERDPVAAMPRKPDLLNRG